MRKKNDPAFLLYSKDWLQGTAQMTPEEKGVYIDLLCHQHQENGLPISTKRLSRLSNLSEIDFLNSWEYLKEKFVEIEGKLFNKKLVSVMNGRSENAEMRTIIGTFGRLLKDLRAHPLLKIQIKESFNYRDFIEEFQQNKQNLSKTISSWLAIAVANTEANIGNGNENEDGNEDGNGNKIKKRGNENLKTENEPEWPVKRNPKNFPIAAEINSLPPPQIKIAMLGVMNSSGITIEENKVNNLWENFKGENLTGTQFYQDIEGIFTHFQRWIKKQKIHNGESNNHQKGKLGNKSGGFAILTDALKKNE